MSRAMPTKSTLDRYDVLLVFVGVLLIGQFVLTHLDCTLPPNEDAAILIRYSQHLAGGQGIVWNVGEKPVEGATDFLFMVLLAVIAKGGWTLMAAARMVGIVSHLVTVGLVYFGIRMQNGSSRLLAFVSAAYLGTGPAIAYIQSCFGTPFFALFACLTWILAIKTWEDSSQRAFPLIFAFSGLVTALIRPEGALLVVLMLIAILYARGLKESRQVLCDFGIVFLLIGGCYFFWRWHYFGYLFPNPYYIKGGGGIYWSSLEASCKNLIRLSGPFALPYVFGLCHPRTRRQTTIALIPIAGFTGLWILLSDTVNYRMRFQYAILPILLVSGPPLLEGGRALLENLRWNKLNRPTRRLLQLLAGAIAAWLMLYRGETWVNRGNPSEVQDFNYHVAFVLARYSNRGYTLATTESGLLPLYSKWRTVDAWGLNDPWIAHHGSVTEQYLRQYRPEVIEFHAPFSPMVPLAPDPTWPSSQAWYSMLITLKRYAENNGYCLAAVYGANPRDAYYYYVRPDFPDNDRIVGEIRNLENVWNQVGWQIFDFAGRQHTH